MARHARLALAGLDHYVVQRAVHDQVLVHDDIDRKSLLDALDEAAREHHVTLWAYALSDRELHLLARPADEHGLGRMMQSLGRRYVIAFNRRHQRQGALWAGRFGAAVVQPGSWMLATLVLIDGLLGEGSPWSSAAHHQGLRRDGLLSDPPEIWALGNTPFERELEFSAHLQRGLEPTVREALARGVRGGWAVGAPDFMAALTARCGRVVTPGRRGRPPKPGARSS